MSEKRLDDLVAALASTRSVLDDLARARVAAVLQAARRAPEPVRRTSVRMRWALAGACAAALALVVGLVVRDRRDPEGAAAGAAIAELHDGGLLAAARGTSVQRRVHGAALTVFGPGWATRGGRKIVVDADALVVDRSSGEGTVELQLRALTIYVQYAAFAVDGSRVHRVTVMRGEILLRCSSGDAVQTVASGGSATCNPLQTAGDPGPRPSPRDPAQLPSVSTQLPAVSVQAPAASLPSASPTALPTALPSAPAVAPTGSPRTASNDAPPSAAAVASTSSPRTASSDAPSSAPGSAGAGPRTSASVDRGRWRRDLAPAPPAYVPRTVSPGDPAPVAVSNTTGNRSPAIAESSDQPAVAPDPAARYAAAEQLMANDPARARALLRALVDDVPAAAEAAPALLDLARLAAAAGDDIAAHAALNKLAAHPGGAALAMAAAYLRCTFERGDASRRACLAGFRASFAESPRDAEILAELAAATARAGDCRAARPLLDEYLRRYPGGRSAEVMRGWLSHCERAASR